ncbi:MULTISPECIES: TonB-dependent receptor [unclassified Vibrio]|uniref:TonB-dependent receptor n=1 Tax=Vibrio sp. HB236076 TaxID=3232307 RepID=A0AB39HJY8_9VIBR|nr:TonB-dependent receptor [Vibrio sp. HB161653]MDP5253207.1 TonB-dependent receptor [Vibrio sp. HB161653]
MKLRSSQVAIKVSPLAIAVASALFTGAVITPSAQAKTADQTLDTITVTGEKMGRSLQETTSAVTVITEDDLAHSNETVSDIATSAPNVNYEGFGNLAIRGVSGSGAALGGVAFYTGSKSRISTVIDGDSSAWSGYSYLSSGIWDTKQVEVLRGPQSMTQGTNSIGGALVVETNDPTFDWESAVRVGAERYENSNTTQNLAVMVSGPIIDDELAFRIAFDGEKGDTWLNYAQANTELDDGPDVEALQNSNLRAKFLWQPSDMPKLQAKLTLTNSRSQGEFTSWANDSDSGFSTQTQTLGDGSAWDDVRLQNSDQSGIATDIDYAVSDRTTNSTHLSYRYTNIYFYTYPSASVTLDQGLHKINFENRTLYKGETFDGLLGVYLSREEEKLNISGTSSIGADGTTNTAAIYGQGGYDVTDDLQVTLGARVQHDAIDRDFSGSNARFSTSYDEGVDDTVLLPKLALSYALSPRTTWGASVQRGYNAGGGGAEFSTGDYDYYTFEKETSISYETGIKSQLSANLNVAANLFYNDFDGYQAYTDGYIVNIDKAHTYGAELEAKYWATADLELRSSMGLLSSKVDNSDSSSLGDELTFAPDFNASLGFTQYLTDNLSLGGNVNYVGEYYSDVANSEDLTAGDYTTANVKLQYLYGPLTFDAYVNNLTDEDVVYFKQNSGTSYRASVGQTRTMGLMVTYKM